MGAQEDSRQLDSSALGQLLDDLLPMARRNRHDGDAITRQFVSRHEPRIHTFEERWQLIIQGRVQGVGFRSSCSRRAFDLGLKGWVKNCRDGSVEVQAEGSPHAIAELRAWCEHGPPGAHVVHVQPIQLPITGDDWFEVRH